MNTFEIFMMFSEYFRNLRHIEKVSRINHYWNNRIFWRKKSQFCLQSWFDKQTQKLFCFTRKTAGNKSITKSLSTKKKRTYALPSHLQRVNPHFNHDNIISAVTLSSFIQEIPSNFSTEIVNYQGHTQNVTKGRRVERTSANSIKVETVVHHTSAAVVRSVNNKDSCILQVPSSPPTSDGHNIINTLWIKFLTWKSPAMTLFRGGKIELSYEINHHGGCDELKWTPFPLSAVESFFITGKFQKKGARAWKRERG